MEEYYEKIAEKVDEYNTVLSGNGDKYYIQKIKPFFVNENVYYEVTFAPANDYSTKSNRIIAFTRIKITSYYAAKFQLIDSNIDILDKTMPINIITGWEVSIRECEFKNFVFLITGEYTKPSYSEQKCICDYLSNTGFSLSDIMKFSDSAFNRLIETWKSVSRSSVFIDVLIQCRNIIKENRPSENILRYLLHNMNNSVIKAQCDDSKNMLLSNLYLKNGCIPFDTIPFINSPIGHNPRLAVLFDCIPSKGRKHELFARFIRNNTEINGKLFTTLSEINDFDNIDELIK